MKKVFDAIGNLVNGIDVVERWIVTILFGEAIIVGFLQVLCRFVLKASLPWSEELLRFTFIWLTYIAASMGIMRGTHSDVRVVVDHFPPSARKWLAVFREVATLVFVAIVFRYSINIISLQIARNQVSPAMKIPMYIPYSGVMVSFGLMMIQSIYRLIDALRTALSKTAAEENV